MSYIKTARTEKIKHLSTYGLLLFLFLTPFEYPLADLMAVSPLRLVGLFAMGLAIVDIIVDKKLRIDYRIIYLLLWLIYGLITIFWVENEGRFQSYYSIYINNAIMFLLFSMISFEKNEIEIFKKSIIFGVGALLLYMMFVPGAVSYSEYQHRLTLNAGKEGLDQNYLAGLMLMAFGFVFYKICNAKQKKQQKVLSIIFCGLIVYFVLLAGSRSGLIALLLISILSIRASWKMRLKIGIPLLIVFLIGLPILARYLPQELMERFSLSALTGQEAESASRLIIWEKALNSLKGVEIIFGYGVGASQTVVGNVLGLGKDMAIHNHYLAMLVEMGCIGFLLINFLILKMNKEMWKKDKSIATSFLGIMIMAFFIDVLTTKFFWTAMILLSVGFYNGKSESEEGNE